MKRTFQPKKIHRAKKHGFLSRSKSVNGRKVLAARRRKGARSWPRNFLFWENEMNRQRPFAARKATHVAFLCI